MRQILGIKSVRAAPDGRRSDVIYHNLPPQHIPHYTFGLFYAERFGNFPGDNNRKFLKDLGTYATGAIEGTGVGDAGLHPTGPLTGVGHLGKGVSTGQMSRPGQRCALAGSTGQLTNWS
jgi:hypothetical protein